jgi:hypothetical protein
MNKEPYVSNVHGDIGDTNLVVHEAASSLDLFAAHALQGIISSQLNKTDMNLMVERHDVGDKITNTFTELAYIIAESMVHRMEIEEDYD